VNKIDPQTLFTHAQSGNWNWLDSN